MKLSELFSKTSKQISSDEISDNAKLLIRAGFVDKVGAGIYTFLPLGVRVIEKISQVVREEMDAIGAQEITMPVLHPKHLWEQSGRWTKFDVLFKTKGEAGEFGLGPTHEEIVVPLANKFVSTYRDLPKYLFQIQTKFRDEPRAKSGLLRGREFLMKDLYSFHASLEDFENYYEKVKGSYKRVFGKLGLEAIETKATGGSFSEFSHEFQVICQTGEDEIIYCPGGDYAENVEIATVKAGQQCVLGHGELVKVKSIEVGNIFPLGDKFSKAFDLKFTDKDGKQKYVVMGCYGIGISRLMGAIVEIMHDEKGIMWPKSTAPYKAHLINLGSEIIDNSTEVYAKLHKAGVDVLWDDREDVSAGEKFADCDLIGIPVRLVVSKKVGKGKLEWKERENMGTEIVSLEATIKKLAKG